MKYIFNEKIDRHGTACIKWDFQKADYGREGLLPFSIADADYATCPAILEALKERIDNGILGYTDLEEDYFQAVSSWCKKRHDWDVKKEWIVPTGGIVPAMANAIEAFTEVGDKVIVQTPVYDPFYSIVNTTKRTLVENPLVHDEKGYSMDFSGLEKACKEGAKILLLCSPHNPVCRVWTKEELSKVVAICKENHVLIISDEIHWDLILGDVPHTTIGVFSEVQDQIVVCTSCSKTFNVAGLETSNLIIPGSTLRETYQNYLYSRYLFCPNTLGLLATKTAYQKGEEWVDQEIVFLKENVKLLNDFVKERLPHVKVAEVQGTYLIWLDMTYYGLDSETLVKKIAEQGAGLNAGSHYGKDYDGFVRMNIACPQEQLLQGLQCIQKALEGVETCQKNKEN